LEGGLPDSLYSPFGECIKAQGSLALENKFRFSTKYSDDETGLSYYGYRYYDAKNGRWVSRDPLGEMGGMNPYLWNSNNGVNLLDLLGLLDLVFNGDWDTGAQQRVKDSFNFVINNMDKFIARANAARIAANKINEKKCPYKKDIIGEFDRMLLILNNMRNYLSSDKKLQLYLKDLGGDYAETRYFIVFLNIMNFNINEKNPITKWNAPITLETVFHELLHIGGVPVERSEFTEKVFGQHKFSDDAQKLDKWVEKPDTFDFITMMNDYHGKEDGGCCPDGFEWARDYLP